MKSSTLKGFGLYVIIFIVIILAIAARRNMDIGTHTKTDYSYSELIAQIQKNENIKQIDIQNDAEMSNAGKAVVYFNDGTYTVMNINSMSSFMETIDYAITEYGLKVNNLEPAKTSIFVTLLPTIIIIIISIIILLLIFQQMQGGGNKVMNFGKSKAKIAGNDSNKVTFDQVAGDRKSVV